MKQETRGRRGRVVAIVQARMTSSRLPGKVLMDICGKPSLQRMLERARSAHRIDRLLVATTVNAADDPVAELCEGLGVATYRGDEHDVLGRFLGAAEAHDAGAVVRLTADCPMIDPELIDQVVATFEGGEWDYVSNTFDRTYPDGLDVEVMTLAALKEAASEARDGFLREHVTPYITGRRPDLGAGDFSRLQVKFDADFAHVRWTLDRADDLERIRRLVAALPEGYRWLEALSVATKVPELLGVGL